MFSKWGGGETAKTDNNGKKDVDEGKNGIKDSKETVSTETASKPVEAKTTKSSNINTILKGSKLTGDINVTCDLELSGDVEGNIRSTQKSNIVIKGICSGNIETTQGSVDIEGELKGGNITAGNDVKITGKFNGGEVKANGRIYVNGEFRGKLEGKDVEIGSNATGSGEIFYREYISISKGAQVEVQISRIQGDMKNTGDASRKNENTPGKKVVDIKPENNSSENIQ